MSAPTGTATSVDEHERQQPGHPVLAGEVPERGRTHRGEREVTQRDLPGALHEQSERQEQDHVDERLRPHRDVAALQHRHEREQRDRDRTRTDADPDRSVVGAVGLHHPSQTVRRRATAAAR